MLDEVQVDRVCRSAVGADQRLKLALSGVRTGITRDKTEPTAKAMNVSVDRHNREAQAEEENAGSGLLADSGKAQQPGSGLVDRQGAQRRQRVRSKLVSNMPENGLNARRFDICQAAAADGIGDPCRWRFSYFVPIRKRPSQRRKRAVRVQVGGVLGKDRRDELIERLGVRMPNWAPVFIRKATFDRAKLARGVELSWYQAWTTWDADVQDE